MTPDFEQKARELAPCPFCGENLKHVESWARSFQPMRLYHEYHHPENDCLLYTARPIASFTDDTATREGWIDRWNRRA